MLSSTSAQATTHPSHGMALLGKLLLELSLHLLSVLYTSMRLRYNLLQVGQCTNVSALDRHHCLRNFMRC